MPGFKPGYKQFIEKYFKIVDKNLDNIPFILNKIQNRYLLEDSSGNYDVILKARQQGFSSIILAVFAVDFLLKPNTRNIIVADEKENAEEMLDKVRYYIESYEETRGVKIPFRYSSKYELYNDAMKSRYTIGTAQKAQFGRSKTVTNLHFSEAAFYPNMNKLLAGAMQAVVPTGRVIIETTANGFNEFKEYWDKSVNGETSFKAIFYKASEFYDEEFLKRKKLELQDQYPQEYPETAIEAFITSGQCFFDNSALSFYKDKIIPPEYFNLC